MASLEETMALGNDALQRGDVAAAARHFAQAVVLRPDSATAFARLGVSLQAQGDLAAAEVHYRRSIALQPGHAQAHYNLGTALVSLGRADEAREHFQKALAARPNYAAAHLNLGAYYQDAGQGDLALAHYEQVLAIEPEAAEAHFNRGLILLSRGEWGEGFQQYEWRLRLPQYAVHEPDVPLWDGRPLSGKTLLVRAEQGLGDTLQFIRYLPLVQARCDRVVAEVHDPLVPLLKQSGFKDIVPRDSPSGRYEAQTLLMSLPHYFDTTRQNVPASVPYLSVDASAQAKWQARMSGLGGLRVGIAWQGSPTHTRNARRSVPLELFAPLAAVPGVSLVCLQKDFPGGGATCAPFEIWIPGDDWDESAGPFVDTAAIIGQLDVVITVDTAVAHLAGALGAPVWLLLSAQADWRWAQDQDTTPWYPTMRLFRQREPGAWSEVLARAREDLARLSRQPRSGIGF